MLASAGNGGLCAFWHLSSEDLIPAAAGFGRDGTKPMPVLRLRRLHAGGATPVKEIPLLLRGPADHGEQIFSVEAKPAHYDAELGLSDAAGGWVMLARSNVFDHGARVDVRLKRVERLEAIPAAPIDAPAPPATPLSDPAQHGSAAPQSSQARDRLSATSVVPEQTGIRAVDVLARNRAGLDRVPVRDPGLDPDRADTPAAEDPVQPDRAGRSPTMPPGSESESEVPPSRDAVSASQGEGIMPEPAHSPERRSSASPTAPMLYGRPTPGGTELLLEAELRVNGCAAPGAMIDLFGQPFRVGPGGRFQLVIRVDDPELMKRAFELNPPDLPDRPADA